MSPRRRVLLFACACVFVVTAAASDGRAQRVEASWYGPRFQGRRMADGAIFDERRHTIASRTLPLGTPVMVTNLENRRRVRCVVTDRGPYSRFGADLSLSVARLLQMDKAGHVAVLIQKLPARGRQRT